MAVWAVQAVEEQPPAGGDPIEWMLLTTCAVHTPAARLSAWNWYACRWGIEVWHKKCSRAAVALKPGNWRPPRDCGAVCRCTV